MAATKAWPRADGAFSEVTGLELTIEPTTFREGGYHLGPRQLIGKTTTTPLVLKRGVSLNAAFWTWIQRCTDGACPLPYVSGAIHAQPPDGDASGDEAVWSFVNGIVTKVKSADLNATCAQDVPMEECTSCTKVCREVRHERQPEARELVPCDSGGTTLQDDKTIISTSIRRR